MGALASGTPLLQLRVNLERTMLQQASRGLLSASSAMLRRFSTTKFVLEGELSASAAFARKVTELTNMEPSFPRDFLNDPKVAPVEGPTPTKLQLTFSLPHRILMRSTEIHMALLPAVSGDFGVMPGHVPTVAELRPGVVGIQTAEDASVEKYFVSGGFAVAHADSTVEITAVEAVKLDELDPAAVKAGLAEYTARLASAGDDLDAAISQVGIEVYSAMDAALA